MSSKKQLEKLTEKKLREKAKDLNIPKAKYLKKDLDKKDLIKVILEYTKLRFPPKEPIFVIGEEFDTPPLKKKEGKYKIKIKEEPVPKIKSKKYVINLKKEPETEEEILTKQIFKEADQLRKEFKELEKKQEKKKKIKIYNPYPNKTRVIIVGQSRYKGYTGTVEQYNPQTKYAKIIMDATIMSTAPVKIHVTRMKKI